MSLSFCGLRITSQLDIFMTYEYGIEVIRKVQEEPQFIKSSLEPGADISMITGVCVFYHKFLTRTDLQL